MKTSVDLILFAASVFSCKTLAKLQEKRSFLKQYAYCRCVEQGLGDSSLFKHDASIGAYYEISYYSDQAIDLVESAAKSFAHQIKPNPQSDGIKAVFFDCFRFYKVDH